MNAKRIVLALSLCCLAGFAFAASDVPTYSIENGYSVGYDIVAADVGSSFDITIGIGVTDNIQAQVSFMPGSGVFDQYRLFGLSYSLLPKLGVTMAFGQNITDSALVSSVGLYTDAFGRSVGGLTTAFRIKLDYTAKFSDISDGLLRVGLAAVIGL